MNTLPKAKKKTYIEWSDDIDGLGRTITIHIATKDAVEAKLNDFDRALLDDIEHGKPSNTPIADTLLGLETYMRRIEEAQGRE